MSREVGATFWVERSAQFAGFYRLSRALSGEENYAPYLFVGTILLIDVPVLSTLNYLREYRSTIWWGWPGVIWWLNPVMIILSVFLLRTLARGYHNAVREAGRGDSDTQVVDATLSRRIQFGTLILGIISYAIWLSTLVGPIFQDEGPVIGGIKFLFIIPLIYIPLATDLAAVYIHVQLVLPLRIQRANVPLDFSDPRHLGGLYALGRVIRNAAGGAFAALTLYTLLWFLGFITRTGPFPAATRITVIAFFALTWSLATAALVGGLYIVHQHMASRRATQLDQIHETIRDLGEGNETLPYTEPADDSEFRVYLQEYVKLDQVERTRTVPINVVVAWELVAAALLPVALQILSMAL